MSTVSILGGRAETATLEGIVSYQVAEEFCNVALKYVALKRFAKPMSVSEAGQYLQHPAPPSAAVHCRPPFI